MYCNVSIVICILFFANTVRITEEYKRHPSFYYNFLCQCRQTYQHQIHPCISIRIKNTMYLFKTFCYENYYFLIKPWQFALTSKTGKQSIWNSSTIAYWLWAECLLLTSKVTSYIFINVMEILSFAVSASKEIGYIAHKKLMRLVRSQMGPLN